MFILRLLTLLLLWLLVRRLWRAYAVARRSSGSRRPRYPGPENRAEGKSGPMKGFTQQKISDADFEELDD